jgi:hypothetical protein
VLLFDVSYSLRDGALRLRKMPLQHVPVPGTRAGGEFILSEVTYVDGSQRSNRRVPKLILTGPEADAAASEFIAKTNRVCARWL